MANKKHFLWRIAAFALLFGVIFSACETGTTPDDTQQDINQTDVTDGQGEELTTVTLLALDEYVTAPVIGNAPVATDINNGQYTGMITWSLRTGSDSVGDTFEANIVYKAVISLTAKTGYTFAGLEDDAFTCSGAALVTLAAAGINCTVTIIFPAIFTETTQIADYLTGSSLELVPVQLQLELSTENWQAILEALNTANKTVLLDFRPVSPPVP